MKNVLIVIGLTWLLWFLGIVIAGDPYEILVRFIVVYIILKEIQTSRGEQS